MTKPAAGLIGLVDVFPSTIRKILTQQRRSLQQAKFGYFYLISCSHMPD
jgi:hypothetical protein